LYTIQPSPVSDLKDYCKTLKVNLKESGRIEAVREQIFASKANCEARLPAIRSLPALVIFGDKDPDFPQPKGPETEAQWIQSKFETGHHVMIEGAGHYPQVESAAAVANHILEFLSTLRIA
jgi:pimeloyl-ACP methyl ester carboxylesterase